MAVIYHAVGFVLGFIADRLFGEINSRFHPICLIGKLISFLEQMIRKVFPKTVLGEKYGGAVLVILVCILVTAVPLLITLTAYKYCPVLIIFTEGLFVYFVTAARSLHDESMKVYYPLKQGDTEAARHAVSMIVGRDTKSLDENGIIRAAVETVAENTSDGVTAPLLWSAVFGGAGGFFYKAVNTMDSMVGYKNDKYINFGTTAARLDDLVNFIPSRICARMMTAAAFVTGMDGRSAYRIWRRDRKKHKSPNAAQTESVCAGALNIRLAGDAYYFGKLYKKEYIGDDIGPPEAEDIRRANKLMYTVSYMTLVAGLMICAVLYLIGGAL